MERLLALYEKWAGVRPERIEKLPQAGSNRIYYRFYGPSAEQSGSVIGVIGQSHEENHAFICLTRHFTKCLLPVPRLLAVSSDEMVYLQSDLGDMSLYKALEKGRNAGGRYNVSEQNLLRRVIRILPEFQVRGAHGLDFSCCYPQAVFDRTSVLFDLYYFKYCFLKAVDIDFHELKLEATFQLMADDLTQKVGDTFLYRDFQARNVMLSADGQPFFIDYQGGRKGPLAYDLVSFLWQASARYSDKLRAELINVYIVSLKRYMEFDERIFRSKLNLFVLFRLMQVLGAYGFRGYFERKDYFIQSIPPAIENMKTLLQTGGCPYPYLNDLLNRLVCLPCFQESPLMARGFTDGSNTSSLNEMKTALKVRVFSFSYRKGIPEDESGNGGGYVFDCRSIHNPGRYESYKRLTGLDEPVVRFLENDGEILRFLNSVYKLADAHVERYMQRGFTDLMFAFGCTGGQHRSVYAAQRLAEHLHARYGIEVYLYHREQQVEQTWPPVVRSTDKKNS